jgi:hypothetical protein
MSYSAIEARVQSLIQALATYDDEDVTRGDERVKDRGSPPYVVLTPGPFRCEPASRYGVQIMTWTVYLDLYTRYMGDGTEWTDLETYSQELVDTLGAYPTLNALTGVIRAEVVSGGEVFEVEDEAGGGPHFLAQRLVLRVSERAATTGGEYA